MLFCRCQRQAPATTYSSAGSVFMETSMVTAVVIGGSRGIGRAVTERLAADGATVAFSYVQNEAAAQAVADGIAKRGGRAVALQADLGDTASIRRLFDAAQLALRCLTSWWSTRAWRSSSQSWIVPKRTSTTSLA